MAEPERQDEQTGNLAASLDGLLTETAKSIAAAIERQDSSTREIARSIHEAASGTQQVSESIESVRAMTHETGASASEVLKSARELSQQSELLGGEAEKFLRGLRTALDIACAARGDCLEYPENPGQPGRRRYQREMPPARYVHSARHYRTAAFDYFAGRAIAYIRPINI